MGPLVDTQLTTNQLIVEDFTHTNTAWEDQRGLPFGRQCRRSLLQRGHR